MTSHQKQTPIAIIGYSHHLPGGIKTDDDFWQLLKQRNIVQVDIATRYGPGLAPCDGQYAPNKLASRFESLITDDDDLKFDSKFFAMSHIEAANADPQHKMMLLCCWEASEMAGLDLHRLKNSDTGVYIGTQSSAAGNWRPVGGPNDFSIIGSCSEMLANRVSYFFNLMGPSASYFTACSAAITALHAAVNGLSLGECSLAFFGGANYLGSASASSGFNALGVISPEGVCKSFDDTANGYLRGEGVFGYVLKRLSDAERDGDKIYGVIRGVHTNTAGGTLDVAGLGAGRYITAPTAYGQIKLLVDAYARAEISLESLHYFEAHATGTQLGDAIEGNAIGKFFEHKGRRKPLHVSSVKSNIGHLEAASFTAGLLKALLMLQHRQFAPISKNFKTPNHNIPFESYNLNVLTECEPFPDEPVRIGINSFGFGGSNGHCIIEEYRPEITYSYSTHPVPNVKAPYALIPLSAKSHEALVSMSQDLVQRLEQWDVSLYDLAANLSTRRTAFPCRKTLSVNSISALQQQLNDFVSQETQTVPALESEPRLLMIFPGQGAQWAGCGIALYKNNVVFAKVVDTFDSYWLHYADFSIKEAMFSATQDELTECALAQPVTCMIQIALFESFKAWGVHPDGVLGHSAGECAAAYASGLFTLEQVCRLVYIRSRLQQTTAGSGRMLVIGLNPEAVTSLIAEYPSVNIACENSESSTVVSGLPEELMALSATLEKEAIFNKFVKGNIAFHSSIMESIKEPLLTELAYLNTQHFDYTTPMISSVTAKVLVRPDAAYWWSNTRNAVKFRAALLTAKEIIKPDLILELSPHMTLRAASQETLKTRDYITTLLRDENDCEHFYKALGQLFERGVTLDFKTQYPRPKPISHLLPKHPLQLETTVNVLADDEQFLKRTAYSAGPLLGRALPNDSLLFETFFSSEHYPWMADHVVQKKPIMPAAGYVELILEALKGSATVCITDIEFKNPCPVSQKCRRLTTRLTADPHSANRYSFTISSSDCENEQNTSIHCIGNVITGENHKFDKIPSQLPSDFAERHSEKVYANGDVFYQQMNAVLGESYSYGPYFQIISEVYEDPNSKRLLMMLDINSELMNGGNDLGYRLHPALFDGALQSLIISLLRAPDVFAIPKRIKNFNFFKSPRSTRLICLYEPPQFWQKMHTKGQMYLGSGECDSGTLALYDPIDGGLVASLDAYICAISNKKQSELNATKYEMIWQTKTLDTASWQSQVNSLQMSEESPHSIISCLVSVLEENRFIRMIEFFDYDPETQEDVFKIKPIYNENVEYYFASNSESLISNALSEYYQPGNKIRLEVIDLLTLSAEDISLKRFRAQYFDLAVVHLKSALTTQLQNLTLLLAPGALVLVITDTAFTPPEGYVCVSQSEHRWLLQAPLTLTAYGAVTTPCPSPTRLIIQDPLGLCWQSSAEDKPTFSASSISCDTSEGILDNPQHLSEFLLNHPEIETIEFWPGVHVNQDFAEKAYEQLLHLIQALIMSVTTGSRKNTIELWVITQGAEFQVTNPHATCLWGLARTAHTEASESGKFTLTLVDIGNNTQADLALLHTLRTSHLGEPEYVIREGHLWVARLHHLIPHQIVFTESTSHETPYRLAVNEPGQLSSLGFVTQELPPLGSDEVEVDIKASALNFRDIMVALERLPLLSFEHSALGKKIGIEAAGVVTKVGSAVTSLHCGDRVVLMAGGSIANTLRVPANEVIPFKSTLSMSEAASSLSVYTTVYYALIEIARMKQGQSLLVHSGMGGIGQAAIGFAKYLGLVIYATAGTAEKRAALITQGVAGAFNSHSSDWAKELLLARQGKGVDVVLNSLAGEHVRLGLDVLAPGGWFCEIGKMDIFSDESLHLQVFRKNIGYRAIDVDRLMKDDPALCRAIGQTCLSLIETGKLPLLPITEYSFNHYAQAFRDMSNGKHTGKLVLTRSDADPVKQIKDNSALFSEKETGLFTGCFGDFGSSVLSYAAAMGLKNFLLLDRDPQQTRNAHWVKTHSHLGALFPDVRIEIVTADVSDRQDVWRAFKAIEERKLPKLTAIFHLAGILDDQPITEQSLGAYKKVLAPKAQGAWNLHLASLDFNYPVKHFVMLSSIVSMLGNPGQANYAAANAFLDGLAGYRQALGLPGLSYNMAAISDKGMAARNPHVLRIMKERGIPAISSYFAIETLDHALRDHRAHLMSLSVSRWRVTPAHPDYLRTGMLTTSNDMNKSQGSQKLSAASITEKLIQKLIELTGHTDIKDNETLSSFGLSSITITEFGVFLEVQFNYSASALAFLSHFTCATLSEAIIANALSESTNTASSDSLDRSTTSKQAMTLTSEKYCQPSEFRLPLSTYFEDVSFPKALLKEFAKVPLDTEATTIARRVTHDLADLIQSHTDYTSKLPPLCEKDLQSIKQFVDIKIAQGLKPIKQDNIRQCLLTGATGFIGHHLLSSLLNENTELQVHCIVRADTPEQAKERIRKTLQRAGIWKNSYEDRITAYVGNIEKDKFGLHDPIYEFLCKTIDSVYHIAANVSLVSSYQELRQTNVLSIKNILDLCLTTQLKTLHFTSTMDIFPEYFTNFSNEYSKRKIHNTMYPNISKLKHLFPLTTFGYPWSKLIVELGLAHAYEHGLPIAIYRLPQTSFNDLTGHLHPTNLTLRVVRAVLQTQCKPAKLNLYPSVPVNTLCDIITQISLSPTRRHAIYHCCHQNQMTETPVFGASDLTLKDVSYKEFKQACLAFGSDSPLHHDWQVLDYFSHYWFNYSKRSAQPEIAIDHLIDDLRAAPNWPSHERLFLFLNNSKEGSHETH
jgi:thioester reductase-like protein